MVEPSRFVSSADAAHMQIFSSEKIEEVIQEMTNLRGDQEFDSDSIDNAIRLCEKMDICFENLTQEEKVLVLHNYEIFSSTYQFTNFLKLMFHGNVQTKENVYRSLFKKLKATQDVTQCILSTESLFDTPEIAEEVQHKLKSFIITLTNNYLSLIPPSVVDGGDAKSLSVKQLQQLVSAADPLFNEREIPYSEIVRRFADLLYAIFSHELMPYYLEWKDAYLRYWLVYALREEDRFDTSPTPSLSTAKAELYVEYINWTKIAKRLNANLRHRQTFDVETTIRAEKVMLGRLPSNVLIDLIGKMRARMRKEENVQEVDLGVEESAFDESSLYNDLVEDIIEAEEIDGSTGSWLGGLVEKIKKVFSPKEEEPAARIAYIGRTYPDNLLSTTKTNRPRFGPDFPKDYPGSIAKQYSLFFTRGRTNYYSAFEDAILEILMVYEERDFSCIENTAHELTLVGTQRSFEFEEHVLMLPIEDKNLLVLGNTYFEIDFKEYNQHPAPYGYFLWYERTEQSGMSWDFSKMGDVVFQRVPLNQIGSHKSELFPALIKVIDSLPDESHEKAPVQQLLHFLHEESK